MAVQATKRLKLATGAAECQCRTGSRELLRQCPPDAGACSCHHRYPGAQK